MHKMQRNRILYVAEKLDKLLEILGSAAEIIMTEIEEAPSKDNAEQEDEEFEAMWDVMVFVERLDMDLDTLFSVEKLPITKGQTTCSTCKH